VVYDNDCLTLLLNSEHATKYVIVYTYPNKFIRDNIVPTFAPTTIVNVTLPTIGCCLAAGLGRRLGLELDLVSVDGREMNSNHIYICLTIKQKYTAQNGKDNNYKCYRTQPRLPLRLPYARVRQILAVVLFNG